MVILKVMGILKVVVMVDHILIQIPVPSILPEQEDLVVVVMVVVLVLVLMAT